MALSKTHIGVLYEALRRTRKLHYFRYLLPSALLPDAIRCFGLPRIITHFEMHPETFEASGICFPQVSELKGISKEKALNLKKFQPIDNHNQPLDYKQVAIGDETSLFAFKVMNQHLPEMDFLGCKIHLVQDRTYDDYIRRLIDCENRRKTGTFIFEGKVYDAKEVRTLIGEFEEQEFRQLAKIIEASIGTPFDALWFEKNVKPAIFENYCEEMAEKTWGYIHIDNESPIHEHLPKSVVSEIIEKMIEETIDTLNEYF